MNKVDYQTLDEYLDQLQAEIREKLNFIRLVVQKLTPKATETICHQIPTFKLSGKVLVHFAGYYSDIGLYLIPFAIIEFKNSLSKYKTSMGTIQFALIEKLPEKLITDMVQFRIHEVSENH